MNINLERIIPEKQGTKVLSPIISFKKTGVVYFSQAAVKIMGLKIGQCVSIYLDSNNNIYVGDGPDFELKPVRPKNKQPDPLCFYNKIFVRQLQDRLDWPLQDGKLTRISYDVSPKPVCINGINVYKLL